MPTTSVIYPAMPTELGTVASYARVAEQTSGRRLWAGQALTIETHIVFAALTGMGFDLAYGTAVTVTPLRHPLTAALNARSIAALSGNPFVAGIGPGATELQRRMLGTPYTAPVTATRRYVGIMRALVNGRVAPASPGGPWPADELELPALTHPQVQIGLGVLRPPMARLAGEVADWVITWLAPPDYTRDRLVPVIAAAAAAVGRPAPRIAAVVHCAVDRPGRDLARLALQVCGGHLRSPHYTDMLNQAGVPVDPADPEAGARRLVESGVVATGSPEQIAATLDRHHAAGVDEVIVNVGGVHLTEGAGSALRDLTIILAAMEQGGSR